MIFGKKYLFLNASALTCATCLCLCRAVAQDMPSDKSATRETIHLYQNLKTLSTKGFMFGHQDDIWTIEVI